MIKSTCSRKRFALPLLLAAVALFLGNQSTQAQTYTWGTASSSIPTGNFSLSTNWNAGAGPAPTSGNGTVLVFGGALTAAYTATQDISSNFTVNALTFDYTYTSGAPQNVITIAGGNSGANTITLGGANPIILSSSGANAGSGGVNITSSLILGATLA